METFVIRIWVPACEDEAPAAELHGLVEHVRSGERGAFTDAGELVAFVAGTLDRDAGMTRPPERS